MRTARDFFRLLNAPHPARCTTGRQRGKRRPHRQRAGARPGRGGARRRREAARAAQGRRGRLPVLVDGVPIMDAHYGIYNGCYALRINDFTNSARESAIDELPSARR